MLTMLTTNRSKRKQLRGLTHEAKTMNDRYRELNDDRFDVIVVGAGTGGLTTAAAARAPGQ
jgi:ribulose 1,5-bisphosphate synthetase/thiazole synthase